MSSVFRLDDLDHVERLSADPAAGFLYARDDHPNGRMLADEIARLDGAEAARVLSSGMAATAAVLLDRLRAGDRLLAARELYGKTLHLLSDRLARLGVLCEFVDATDEPAVAAALATRPALFWVEALSNPLLRATRIDRFREWARAAKTTFVVDGTFTPPPMLQPLALGADLVVHSLTKFHSGHSDVTLGSVSGSAALVRSIAETASTFGFHAAAFDCWLTQRGLATLPLRLERACANALRLAQVLKSIPTVRRVYYPGLSDHPDCQWLDNQAGIFGFLVSFELAERESVNRLFRRLKHVRFCPSLGDVATTVSHPASTSHRGLRAEERAALGIHDGLVRVSVGIEPVGAICDDFAQALAR